MGRKREREKRRREEEKKKKEEEENPGMEFMIGTPLLLGTLGFVG